MVGEGARKGRRGAQVLAGKGLNEAGFIATYHLDPRAIATLREEARRLLEEPLEDQRAAAYLQMTLGMMAMIEQDHEQVVARLEEALVLLREAGDIRSCAMCLTSMGVAAVGQGDAGRAARMFEETLGLLQRLKDKIGAFYSLMGMAGVAALQGRPARAARLFGASGALREAIGHPAQPLKQLNYDYESHLANARAALGETDFGAAFHEGRTMSPEQAIEYALSADEPVPPAMVAGQTPGGSESRGVLTRREQEVALLVARGLTNHRIASEFAISKNTVANHVAAITRKLNVPSRSLIAVWVTERRLDETAGQDRKFFRKIFKNSQK